MRLRTCLASSFFAEWSESAPLLAAVGFVGNSHLNDAGIQAWIEIGIFEMLIVFEIDGRLQITTKHLTVQ